MRLAIVSDMHGHMTAFEAVLADLETVAPDLVIHGGDLCFNGPRPAEVIDRVRELGWPGVAGNTDQNLWQPRAGLAEVMVQKSARTRELIGAERLEWLRSLPPGWRDGDRMALVHAVPGDLWEVVAADAPDSRLREVYGPLGAGVAVYCHIHVPYVRVLDGLTVANSGSAGLPFDGDPRASYLVVEDGRCEVRRVAYDIELAASDVLRSGYPGADRIADLIRTAIFTPG